MIISRWLFGAALVAFGVFFGSRTSSSADVNIVGGTATNRYDGSGVRVLVDQARRRYCTAVAVDANTLLMAAHCIKDASLEASVFAELRAGREGIGPIKAQRYYSWSAVRNREILTDQAAARDLAVVIFDGDPFKGPFLRLAPEAVQGSPATTGTKVKIVGFGASIFSLDASVAKENGAQEGANQIAAAEQGLYVLTADLSPSAPKEGNAAAAAGDAGGPLLNAQGELLGIGAGVRLLKGDKNTTTGVTEDQSRYAAARPEGAAFAQNSFVDLGSESSRKLLAYAISTEKKLRQARVLSHPTSGCPGCLPLWPWDPVPVPGPCRPISPRRPLVFLVLANRCALLEESSSMPTPVAKRSASVASRSSRDLAGKVSGFEPCITLPFGALKGVRAQAPLLKNF